MSVRLLCRACLGTLPHTKHFSSVQFVAATHTPEVQQQRVAMSQGACPSLGCASLLDEACLPPPGGLQEEAEAANAPSAKPPLSPKGRVSGTAGLTGLRATPPSVARSRGRPCATSPPKSRHRDHSAASNCGSDSARKRGRPPQHTTAKICLLCSASSSDTDPVQEGQTTLRWAYPAADGVPVGNYCWYCLKTAEVKYPGKSCTQAWHLRARFV